MRVWSGVLAWLVAVVAVAACGSRGSASGGEAMGDAMDLRMDAPDDPRCTVCAAPWGVPGAGCTDVRVDPANCGACDVVCPGGACSRGVCVQPTCSLDCAGTGVCCGASCTNPNRDLANCGSCGNACVPGATCESGACECHAPRTSCPDACTYLDGDPANCGACGHVCDPQQPVCYDGTCHECARGQFQCGAGCIPVAADPQNCGACGVVCDATQPLCYSGSCHECGIGQTKCAAGCTVVAWDPQNCGACGVVCAGSGLTGQCANGSCVTCAGGGLADCSGTCTDLKNDHESCGACGHACGATEECVNGTCVGGDAVCANPCETNTVCCANGGTPTCFGLSSALGSCGQCGNVCTTNACVNGQCVTVSGGGDDD